MIDPITIIQEINQQLDGVALTRLFNYHADKLQINGSTLKCYCPIHHEMAFRSLVINLTGNTYKCMMKQCDAFPGGTLVQLWGLYRTLEPIEAALELVELLKLPVDLGTVRQLGTTYSAKAHEQFEAGELAGARQALDQALAFDPYNLVLRLFSAQIHEAAGQADQALAERLQVLDTWLAGEDPTSACELLDRLLETHPAHAGLLERRAALIRREGQPQALKDALIQLAEARGASADPAGALAALEEAARVDGQDAALIERLARCYLQADRQEEALELLNRLSELLEAAGQTDALLETLEHRATLRPDDLEIALKIATVLEQAGRWEEARGRWLQLAGRHDAQGRSAEAEWILARLLEREPRDVVLLQRVAEHFASRGDTRRAVAAYRHLAGLAQEVGETERVGDFFECARRIDPQDPGLRRDQAEWKLKRGDMEGGLADLFNLADLYLEKGERDPGMAVLARIATLAPADLDKRVRIGRCLERNGLAGEAYASYCQLAQDLMRQQQFDAAQVICEESRRLQPDAPATLDLRIETHLALRQQVEAIEACRETARRALAAGRPDDAEAALLRAAQIDRTENQARTDLALLYENTGRAVQAAKLWIEMALSSRSLEDYAQGCAAAREALRLAPSNREARVILGEGLESQGQVAEALEIWEGLAEESYQGDSVDQDAYEMFCHALELAPRKRFLLERVAGLALRIDGPAAARDYFNRWLETFNLELNREEAIESYRIAVDAYPEELDWRTRLADLLLKAGERLAAARHLEVLLGSYRQRGAGEATELPLLEQLVTLCPERLELRRELAVAMARQGHARVAAAVFEALGRQYLNQGDRASALESLQQALESRPEQDEMLATVARLLEESGRIEEAIGCYERLAALRRRQTGGSRRIEVIEKLFALQPARLELRAELAELCEMEADVERAVEHRFALAMHGVHQGGQADQVIDECEKIRALAPEFMPARELLVEVLLEQSRMGPAKAELESLGDLALASGRVEGAEGYFKRIQELAPDDIGASERLGKLYEARQRPEEAASAFSRVLEIYVRMNEVARAIGVLKKLKQLRPGDLELSQRLARMLLEQGGDRREAAEEWLGLIEQALARGDAERGEAALTEGLVPFAQDWPWRLKALRALTAAGRREFAIAQWEETARDALAVDECETAREAAGAGLQLAPDREGLRELRIEANSRLANEESAVADLRELAERAACARDFARAEACLRRALAMQPRREEVMEALAEVLAAAGRREEACALERKLAELLRQSGRRDQAIRRARRIVEMAPEDEDARDYLAILLAEDGQGEAAVGLWRVMAEEAATRGQLDAALGRYVRLLELCPGDIDLLRRLADLTYENGGMMEAMAAYDRLIDALHAAGDLARLEAEFLRILELEPGHLQMKERLADFLFEQGRCVEGRQLFRDIVTIYGEERGQLEDALRVMRHVKALDSDDLEVREDEAGMLERAGRAADAVAAWRQVAVICRRAGLTERCAEALGRAAELDGDRAETQLEAARVHGLLARPEPAIYYYLRAIEIHDRHDRIEECVPMLREAIRLDPERLDLADALARIYERLGLADEALRQWLALGAAHEEAGQGAAARSIYAHVRTLLPEELETRRRLARLCEAEGDRAGALRELHELAALAERADGPERQAEYLERILALDPADEEALLTLAEAWRTLGRADALCSALGRLERFYATTGRQNEALMILAELRSLTPEDTELLSRSIELLIKTGQTEEAASQAIALMQGYFARGDDHHALETLRRIAEIEPGNIDRRISLARLVHDSGRPVEALQEFYLTATKLFGETQWEGCLRVCEAGLAHFPEDMRLRDLMGRVLTRLGLQGEAIEVQLHLAALYDERGEEAKARRLYEMILDDQPDHQGTLEAMAEWALRHGKSTVAVDHLLRLAESHYLAGRLDLSIAVMERIQTLDPGRLEVRARLAETYLEAGDEENAISHWMATAAAMAEGGRNELAIEIYERLLMLRPEGLAVMVALLPLYAATGRNESYERLGASLGESYLREGHIGVALDVFAQLSQRYPNDQASWERLAGLYEREGRIAEAVGAYRHLYEIHSAQRRLEPARRSLETALALQPGDPEMMESLGDLCLALSRRPEGVTWLTQAAQALAGAEDPARARDLAQRILKLDPLNLDVRRLLAQTLEAVGERTAALEEYLQAARAYAENYQNEPAITILDHLLTLDPMRVEERELYARLLQREGRVEESISQYLILLELVEESDDPRRAIKYCRQILAEQPDHPLAHVNLCEIYARAEKLRPAFKECEWLIDYHLARKEYEEAERHIMKGLGWFPDELGPRTRLVEMLSEMDRRQEAGEQLAELARMAEARADTHMTEWAMAKACEIEPDKLEHHCRLADYQERTGNLAGARQTRLGMVRLLLGGGRVAEARQAVERLVAAASGERELTLEIAGLYERFGLPEEAAALLYLLARGAALAGEYEEAKELARSALTLQPRHTGARETLIEALRVQRELNAAVEECERLYEIFEETGEWDGALRVLQSMIDMVPSRPEPRRRLVRLYRKMRREDAMVDQLRRLAEIQVNAGELDGAISSLRELLDARPDDSQARGRYIDLYTQLGDESELREDYLVLARGCMRKGQLIEATRAYEKVIALAPEDPAGREEFVTFLFDQGQVHRAVEETGALADLLDKLGQDKDAGRVLERALNYAPQELDLRQRLAAVYLRTNRRGLALETYRTLARQFEHADDEARLLAVVEQIVAIDHLNVEFRQRLADLLAQQGRRDEAFEQFGNLARQYEERDLFDLAEHEYRRMLALRPDHVAALERIIEIRLKTGGGCDVIPEMKSLAEYYAEHGQLKETVRLYRQILQHEPENTEMLNCYLDSYMQIGLEQDLVDDFLQLADLKVKKSDLAEAMSIYKRLLDVEPDNVKVREKLTETQRLSQGRASGAQDTIREQSAPNGHKSKATGKGHTRVRKAVRDEAATVIESPSLEASLAKVLHNYENLVLLNPANPALHTKLAEVLEQAGQRERADNEWVLAADAYLAKGELHRGLEIYECCLKRHPDDFGLRERLSKARLQQDSLRAIEGALIDI